MSHIVMYEASDGSSGFERCTSLDAAVTAAERLRNVDGVALPRIYRLEEVQFDFKPYFRVQVSEGEEQPTPVAVEPTVIPEPPSSLTADRGTDMGTIAASALAPLGDPPAMEAPSPAEEDALEDVPGLSGTALFDSMTEGADSAADDVVAAGADVLTGEPEGDPTDGIDEVVDIAEESVPKVRKGLFGR